VTCSIQGVAVLAQGGVRTHGRTTVPSAARARAQAKAALTGPVIIPVPCSANALSAAINAANTQDAAVLALRGNCTYSITTPATVANGLPLITGNVTLSGSSGTVIQRSATAKFRVLDVALDATLTLKSVSVRGGNTASLGGAILNAGTLIVDGGHLFPATAPATVVRYRSARARPRAFPGPCSPRTRQPVSAAAASSTSAS
jgi:hypothetical protein